jgi:hypothetical protein
MRWPLPKLTHPPPGSGGATDIHKHGEGIIAV